MANKTQLKELNKLLADLEAKYKSLNRISPFKDKDAKELVKSYGGVAAATKTIETNMKGIRADILEINSGLDSVKDTFNDIAKELGNIDNPLKNMSKGFKRIRNFAEELSDIQYDLTKSSVKQTRSLQVKVDLEFKRLTRETKSLQNQIASGKLTGDELKNAQELLAFAVDEAQTLENKVGHQDKFNKALEDTIDAQKNINRATGLTGKAISGLAGMAEKIGFGDLAEPLADIKSEMKDQAVQLTNNGEKAATLGDQFRIMGTGLAGIGKALGDALSDPLVIITMIVKAVKFLASIFDHVLKLTNKIGQSVGTAGKNAEHLKKQIHAAGDGQKDMFYFTDEIAEAYMSLNQAAGTNLKFNEENAKTFQDLTLYMGVSSEAAAELFKLSASTGVSYSDMYDNVRDVTEAMNSTSNYSMSTQDAIEAIAQSSSAVRFNIGGSTAGLVKAAHTAARLGMSMNEIAAAAETHLDFESSISKEIEAEMFLQKDLNLDKLRMAAITGDTDMAAREQERIIRENAHLIKKNVPAQKALAATLGLSHEQLLNSLETKKKLAGLDGQQLEDAQASAEEMKTAGQTAQTFDRSMQNAANQLKAALLPIAEFIGPTLIAGAKFVSEFLGTTAGKGLMQIAGLALGGTLLVKAGQGIASIFTKGMSAFGKLGSSALNAMYVRNVGGGGGDNDTLNNVIKLGTRNKFMGNFFKKFSGLVGGKNSMLGRQLRNFSAMALRRSSVTNQIVKSSGFLSKILPSLSTLNSGTSSVGEAAQATKVANAALQGKKVADVAKVVNVTAKTTTAFSKVGTVLGAFTKKIPLIGAVLDVGIGGFTGASQAGLTAEEQKATGVKEGIHGVTATGLGVLTGGAEKGSMFSETLGIEKGGVGDEALGIGMAGARGAMVGASIGAFLAPFTAGASVAVGAAVGGVIGTVGESFKVLSNPDSAMRKELSEGLSSMGTAISDFGTKAWDKTKEWTGIAGEKISNFAGEAKDSFMSFASETAESFKDFDTAKETLSSFASSAFKTISGFFSSVGSGVSSLASGAADMASKAGSYLADTVSNLPGVKLASSVFSAAKGLIGFADGGIVTQPVKGIVGEAGPEAIIPLSQAGDMLGSTEVIALLKELISTVNKGGDVYLDGAKVGYTLALQSSKMG